MPFLEVTWCDLKGQNWIAMKGANIMVISHGTFIDRTLLYPFNIPNPIFRCKLTRSCRNKVIDTHNELKEKKNPQPITSINKKNQRTCFKNRDIWMQNWQLIENRIIQVVTIILKILCFLLTLPPAHKQWDEAVGCCLELDFNLS